MRILQIGVDKTTLDFLRDRGIVVEKTGPITDVAELEDWLVGQMVDAVVLNLAVGQFGVYVARHLRNNKIDVPLVGISAPAQEGSWTEQRALFLEQGGDDLLRGPANPRELNATLFAISRRYRGAAMSIVEVQHKGARLKINLATRSVWVNTREPLFTPTEHEMVLCFAQHVNRVLSKEALMTAMYSLQPDDAPDPKIIDVYVHKLRKKFSEIHPDGAELIETVWGQGYRLVPSQSSRESASAA